MSVLMTGTIKTVGDETTRQWTFNITDFAKKGESYQSGEFVINKNGDQMFPKHSIYGNGYET